MEYLGITSALNAVCFLAATVLFSISVVKHKDNWRGDLSILGFVASLGGALLYTLNTVGVLPYPISPVIDRPVVLLLAIFILVTAFTLWRK